MPVSSSSKDTCPAACPLMGSGCYGESGPVSIFWRKVDRNELKHTWGHFLGKVAGLFPTTLWRHNQVGDLPHIDQEIDIQKAMELAQANRGKRGFTFTHHEVMGSRHNRDVIKFMNESGFTVNLSADSLEEADAKASLGIAPVSVILPKSPPWPDTTPQGRKILVCLNVTHHLTCLQCKLCQVATRKTIIGFPAHGTGWRKAQNVFFGEGTEK